MDYLNTTRSPFECHVEVDTDWMHRAALPGADSDQWETVDSSFVPSSEPVGVRRFMEMGRNARSVLLGLGAMTVVVFFGSLAIAERSGQLHDIRDRNLSIASRALMVLGLGAMGGTVFYTRNH
ncbi:hypothetical protein D0962_34500 [Leptolyngbyaceae cyanobacterium CCMR0082]|uniref:Uncharacterized protein n=1 Tax=Adonisia turfae CCMR0082 TaxID=2304604 RepID=A0A6M0SGW5_9CYAN|nr:hypothetical protein [Adonisia turfae]NEZ67809.1 hypothetical protein [Adonisia turfae CCMR0082]